MTRKIGIVCCSDGFNRAYEGEIEELHRILADMGIESVLSPFLYARDGVASGTAEERAKAVMDFYLDDTIDAIGDCNTALSMIVIGGILSDVPKEKIFDHISILYSALRLLVLPLLIFAILLFLPVESMVRNVCVLLSAMPTAMLAQRYEKDPEFASRIIFVSTLLSMLTLPLIFLLLEWL